MRAEKPVIVQMKPIYLDLAGVTAAVALSTGSVQKLVREEKFPKPRAISDKRVGWLVREVEEWAESRPVSDFAPPPNTGWRKGLTGSSRVPQAEATSELRHTLRD